LGQVADDLAGGCDLDDVAEDLVGLGILLLDLLELGAEAEAEDLELEVGVLAAGDLVSVATLHGRRSLERRVEHACLFPVEQT
jgi:hypothetical protein